MIEKQFTHKDKSLYIDDDYFCELEDGDEITELLNRQQYTIETVWKENEQLKQENERLCNFKLHMLLDEKNKEIEQLKQTNQELVQKKNDLKDLLVNSETVLEQKELQKLIYKMVIDLIDEKIKEYKKYDGYDTEKYYIGTGTLKELKKELKRE